MYSERRPQTYHITKYFSRSISTSFASRNTFPKTLVLSFLEESKKEDIGLDPKTSTALRVITGRLSFKKVLSLKLSAVLSISISKGKISTMS